MLALSFDDPDEEAVSIVAKIQELHGTAYRDKPESEPRGLTYSDMAILLRSVLRNDARPIVQALDDAEIPYIVSGVDGLFDTPEIQAVRQVFFYLADFAPRGQNPPTEAGVRATLAEAGFGLSAEQVDAGLEFLNERKRRM